MQCVEPTRICRPRGHGQANGYQPRQRSDRVRFRESPLQWASEKHSEIRERRDEPDDTKPELLVYNRSDEGLAKFKDYAEKHELKEGYKVVRDLKEIGQR